MTFNRNLLSDAVRYGLAAGAVGLFGLATAPAHAQDTTATDQPTKDSKAKQLDTITVTGSRIRRSQVEGPNPVTIITRKDLEVKGDLSVADVLRSSTFNSFGSLIETSGNSAQSQATINLRGLGSQRTLVLIDGRRIAGSPVLGGNVQNLNMIPFAAVERIEILRDGASAIYGADAIGGVVNIIMRKDFEGLQISAGVERPTKGEPYANSGSIVGGITSDKGNITFVLDHQERDIFYNRDRPVAGHPGANPAVGLSAFGFPPSAILYNSTDGSFSGSFAGIHPDPRCPTALGSDPLFPSSVKVGSFCRFNYADTNANAASLKRDSVMINSNYQISDNITAFTRVSTMTGTSLGVYAPTPFTNFPTMAGNNPNNVFHKDAVLYFRFVPGGNRVNITRDHMLDVLFGLEGQNDWFGGANWSVALHHNRYEIDSIGTGYALGPPLQGLIDDGTFNPFGDPRDPSFIKAVAMVSHTVINNAQSRYFGGDAQINFDLFQMANGPAGFAAGVDYRDESYQNLVDAQSAAGNVLGTAGGNSRGERAAYAVFAELNLPILKNLAVDLAGRFDHYNDFGSSFNPKISVEFRPVESLLLRADYGTGFRAPSLSELHRAPAQTFTSALDTLNCPNGHDINGNLPFDPCSSNQYEGSLRGNEALKAEKSKSWSVGAVWSPLTDMNFSLDYYDIKLKDQITTLGFQTAVDIAACANPIPGNAPPAAFCAAIPNQLPPNASVTRNSLGKIVLIVAPAFNAGGFHTSGFDFDANYKWNTSLGTWSPELQVTYVTQFKTKIFANSDEVSALGLAVPKLRANATMGWSKGDFGAQVTGNLIGNSRQLIGGNTVAVPYYTTFDIQATWSAPWKGKFTLGIRNMADRTPPLSKFFPSPHYLHSQYDFLGRVPYMRYEQNF
ncbi:MAG: TonB-dependent receptor [Lysobacteraceae bacterium]